MLLMAAPQTSAQKSVTETAEKVNKKLVKLFGAGGIKGLPSYGTGIVVSKNGHILTVNNHILTTQDLRVHLYDGRFFHAKVVAKEPALDVALLKLDEPLDDLPYYDINVEADPKRPIAANGTWVLAFSNEFAIAEREEPMSVQHGLVCAYSDLKGRKGVADAPYQGKVYFLDVVACNPGAAGGALTDSKGNLLGILGRELKNKLSDSWINYAVPIQASAKFIKDEKTKEIEEVSIAKFVELGMAGKYVAKKKAGKEKGPGVYTGIQLVPNPVALTPPYIESVVVGSPADKAGLKTDDLIVYLDGELVQSIKTFRELLTTYQPNNTIRLDVQRGGQFITVTLTLEKAPTK
jgi:serine protease Do